MKHASVVFALLLAGCAGSTTGLGSSSTASASSGSAASSSSAGSSGSSSSGSASATSSSSSSGSGSMGSTGSASSASSGSGSSGTTGRSVDAGHVSFHCRVVLDGGVVDVGMPDGGCSPSLPDCAGQAVPLEPEIHVPEPQQVTYLAEPPPSGPHWPCWAPWGVGHAATALNAERFVHNLEHGGVVLLYQCAPDAGLVDGGGCAAMAAPLVAYAVDGGPRAPAGDARYVVTARPEQRTAYAALAWGWRLELDALDAGALDCFARLHLGAAPENFGGNPDPTGCPQSYAP